jgi:hypothetical protein
LARLCFTWRPLEIKFQLFFRLGCQLEACEQPHCFFKGATAHIRMRTQAHTYCRSLWLAVQCTTIVSSQVDTAHAGWLTVEHTRNR